MPNDQSPSGAFPTAKPLWSVRGTAPPVPAAAQGSAIQCDTRYTITWLGPSGMIKDRSIAAPATSLFTHAFAAIARGAIVPTPNGSCAIEDLLPGDRVITDRGTAPLLWKGSRIIAPRHKDMPLYRIAAGSLGPSRPSPDLLLGPAARLVSRRTALRGLVGADAALVPVASVVDGDAVIRIKPPSSMQVFHLGFARHATFTVNGLQVESVHPGYLKRALPPKLERLFMSMFPHLTHPSDFGGLALHRLHGDVLQTITQVT